MLLAAGLAFGVAMAVIKGQDTGVRDALGNTSAPWVLLPFIAGSRCTSVPRAALAGLGITLAALLGFYAAEAAVLDLGPHPWYVDLQLTLGTVNVYEKWGVVTGTVYGALGGLWAVRWVAAAPIAVALAFVCEPVIVWGLGHAGIWGDGGLLLHYGWMWAGEILIGLAGIAYVVTRLPGAPRPA